MNEPKIAVLLAAYNGMRWIDEQLETIIGQKNVSVSIYISVDKSTDGTYEWAKSVESRFENIHVLSYGEIFGGAAPNFFRLIMDVDFSSFDAVALADQDDIWMAEKLCRAYGFIDSAKCDVYSSNVTAFWADGRESLIKKSQPQRALDHFFEAAGPGCTYVFNKNSIQIFQKFLVSNVNSIKKIELHDWLAYAFCREQGLAWFIDDSSFMRYRQHEANQVGTNNNLVAYKKRFNKIRDNWLRNQVASITSLVAPDNLDRLSSRFFLISNFSSLRRRFRDRIFLLIMIFLGIY